VSRAKPTRQRLAIDASRLAGERTGIENFIYHLLPRLAAGWQSGDADSDRCVTVFASRAGTLLPPLPDAVRIRGGGGPGWTQLKLPIALAGGHADVLFMPIPILPLLAPIPCPAVVTVHDLHEFRARWSYLRRVLAVTFRRASRIICVSEATRMEVVHEFPHVEARCTVVYEGAAESIFFPRPAGEPATLPVQVSKFGISGPPLLALGTIQPRKNLARLIRAYARLGASAPPLVIVGGNGWQHEEVLALPRALGLEARVVFTGYLPDVTVGELMRTSLALCAVSTAEGFGLPLVEAMHSGLPIVASDIPPFREVAGPAATYVDPLDEESIAAGLETMIGSDAHRRELAQAGLQRGALFSWESTAQAVTAELQAAAG
jgi:glycosyltransferase involved in cell wall biosynthesis